MTIPYRIRVVEENDGPGILSIARQLGYSASEHTVNDLLGMVTRQENHQMVLADGGDKLLGYIHLICNQSDPSAQQVEIAGILLPDENRGMGIGSAFLKEAEKWSRGRDIKTVSIRRNLIRKDALAFFKHHGFNADPAGDVLIKNLV